MRVLIFLMRAVLRVVNPARFSARLSRVAYVPLSPSVFEDIGSHTVLLLLEAGYNVVVADNLVNSR